SRGDGRVLSDALRIDVQRHAGAAHRCYHVVPLAIVVRRPTGDRHSLTGIDAEDDLPGVVHVEVTVIAAAVTGVAVTETDDLATRRRRRVDPRFDRERVRPGLAGRRYHRTGRGAVEGRRRVAVADDCARRSAGHATADDAIGVASPVVGGKARGL